MRNPSSQEIKGLREGAQLVGEHYVLHTQPPFPSEALLLCGSEVHLKQLHINPSESVLQLIDTEEALILSFELEDGGWRDTIVDLGDGLGTWAMQARRPIALWKKGDALPSESSQKTLPLQPDSEAALKQALAHYKKRFRCYRNGSFKIEHNDA